MARIFLLLAIVLGILWWLRDRAGTRHHADPKSPPRRTAAEGEGTEPMVQCAHCGVHLPRGDAIAWHGLHYCRRSHLPEMPGEGDHGARS
jgi:uncharacterized protein